MTKEEIQEHIATIGGVIAKPGEPSQEDLVKVGAAGVALLAGFLVNVSTIADALSHVETSGKGI